MAVATEGTAIKVGFGTSSYTGYLVQEASTSSEADEEIIQDEVGDTVTVLTWDPKVTYDFDFVILDAGGSLTPPARNDVVTLTAPDATEKNYRVTSATVTHAIGATRLSLSVILEASMDAVYTP